MAAKEQVRKFLQIITEDDSSQNLFDVLAANVTKRLEKCFFSCVSTEVCRSKFVKREKAWRAFHQLRVGELGKTWCDFFGHDGIPRATGKAGNGKRDGNGKRERETGTGNGTGNKPTSGQVIRRAHTRHIQYTARSSAAHERPSLL